MPVLGRPQCRNIPVQLQLLADCNRLSVGKLECLNRIRRIVPRGTREHLRSYAAEDVNCREVASPTNFRESLLIDSI
ncbi:MAG: hypothetical protein DMG97_00670 [Acidobacteria bacterium]|nr:MAG: hypothetical protein DMG96_10175 [Acidobacteriota bacterium]PYV77926.1 MAG: hypothetical protein DMG97_00670 [Acidobacteriota bacterium]